MFTVIVRSSLVRAVTGLCVSSALVACDVEQDEQESQQQAQAQDANTMMADLPTSATAVRIALFAGDAAPANSEAMLVWPAWVILEDDGDTFVLDLGGGGTPPQMLNFKGVPFPAVDLEFGEPPAASIIEEEDGGRFALPVALVLDRSIDPATLTRLGDLDDAATLGLSSYLGYVPEGGMSASLREGGFGEGITDQTGEGEEPSKLSFVGVGPASAHFAEVASTADIVVR